MAGRENAVTLPAPFTLLCGNACRVTSINHADLQKWRTLRCAVEVGDHKPNWKVAGRKQRAVRRGGPTHQAGEQNKSAWIWVSGTSARTVPLSANPVRSSPFRWDSRWSKGRFLIGSRQSGKSRPGAERRRSALYLGGEWPEATVASSRPYLSEELPPGDPLGHRDRRSLTGTSNHGTLARVCLSPSSPSGRDRRIHPQSWLDAEVPPPQLYPVRTCQLLPCQDLWRPASGPQPLRAPSPNSAFPVFASPWQPGQRRHVIAPVFW